jgi:hypothetical protein
MIKKSDLDYLLCRASSLGIDTYLVNAFNEIDNTGEARNFRDHKYPLQVVGEFFPNINEEKRGESLDSIAHIEINNSLTKTAMTPRTIAELRIGDAYDLYVSFLGEDDSNVKLIRKIWGFA